MDECAIRKEFEEWAARNLFHMRAVWFERSPIDGAYRDCRTQDAWVAWIESTRRADDRALIDRAKLVAENMRLRTELNTIDKAARLDCVDICGKTWVLRTGYGVDVVKECQKAILATIPEE